MCAQQSFTDVSQNPITVVVCMLALTCNSVTRIGKFLLVKELPVVFLYVQKPLDKLTRTVCNSDLCLCIYSAGH